MSKLSIRELKKKLNKKTKAELIDEIVALSKKFKQVKEYYYTQDDPSKLEETLKKYKEIIEKEFIEGKTRGFPKLRFSVARKAINDFKKISKEPKYLVELMLCYAESVSWFSSEFGPDSEEFYTKPENLFEEALQLASQHNIEEIFRVQAYEIVVNACEGWGHQDTLREIFLNTYGDLNTAK
ncbi:MAG: DUF6155 family protein [Bacteroidota bacterium]